MAKIGKVTRNSKELFFGGGMGMIIPLRPQPSEEKNKRDNRPIDYQEDSKEICRD